MSAPAGTARTGRRETRPRARTQQKLEHLLAVAAALIARQGYEQTGIRDVGRETGASLPGMYYYFRSKEDLLFQIQHRTFSSLIDAQERELERRGEPDEVLRRLIIGHLAFFSTHPSEMKVCAFELESLRGDSFRRIEDLRRRYYRLVAGVVEEILRRSGSREPDGKSARHVTLFVFGMLNWVFMWFDPERDGPAERLGEKMTDLVLHGLDGAARWK